MEMKINPTSYHQVVKAMVLQPSRSSAAQIRTNADTDTGQVLNIFKDAKVTEHRRITRGDDIPEFKFVKYDGKELWVDYFDALKLIEKKFNDYLREHRQVPRFGEKTLSRAKYYLIGLVIVLIQILTCWDKSGC